MSRIALDASAILAMIYGEPGAAKVIAELHSGEIEPLVSAVNLCEVQTRLLRDNLTEIEVSRLVASLKLTVKTFDEAYAGYASSLYPETKALGLSLGDRACLALGIKEQVTVWTADRVWKKLNLSVSVELIRI